jgi:hypothetical protein
MRSRLFLFFFFPLVVTIVPGLSSVSETRLLLFRLLAVFCNAFFFFSF